MQAQTQKRHTASSETILAFKRHILTASSDFICEPQADAFRVNLLARMLDRYDELSEKGMSELSCRNRTIFEFDSIAAEMRELGFVEAEKEQVHSRWPQMTMQEAERYIRERDAYMHKTAMGIFLCAACLVPMMLFAALGEAFFLMEDFFALFGVAGMFAMIGTGVYAITTAVKPRDQKKISKGRFSLGRSVRQKLEAMREKMEQKARKRMGRGVALCVTSLIPMLVGAAFSEAFYSDVFPIVGIAGMFLMIGMGVYELVMADGEKKTIGRLLKEKE